MDIFSFNFIVSVYAIYLMIDKIYQFIYFIYSSFFRQEVDLLKRYESKQSPDQWVLITGPTEGIGKEFAYQFGSRGFNLILSARNEKKLKELEADLKLKYKSIQTRIIVCDFSNFPYEFNSYESLYKEYFEKYNITILVNNVGMLLKGLMSEITIENVYEIIKVNILPQLYLSKIFINSRKDQKGGIISLSSTASEVIKNNYNLYLSTKHFNKYLSKGIAIEEANIDSLCVKPGVVSSKMSKYEPDGKFIISTQECVNGIFKDFVYDNDTYGNWKHKVRGYFYSCLPERLSYKILSISQKMKKL